MALVYKGDSETPISTNLYSVWAEDRCQLWITPSMHVELTKDETQALRDDLAEQLRNW
jgi:hypothetical protein